MRHGKGIYIFSNGDYYEGEYLEGEFHGFGKYVQHINKSTNEVTTYIGQFKNNYKHGQGKELYADGSEYQGEFKQDKWDGKGLLIGFDRLPGILTSKYIGFFKNGQFEGFGECLYNNGEKYIGQYREGKRCGKGTYYWPNLKDLQNYEGDDFYNDIVEVKGFGVWPYGRKYTGENKNNKMHGQGMCTWPDGKIHNGTWKYNY